MENLKKERNPRDKNRTTQEGWDLRCSTKGKPIKFFSVMEERELNLRNGFSFLGLNRETQLKLLVLVTVWIGKIGLLFEEDRVWEAEH